MFSRTPINGWQFFQGSGVHTADIHCDDCTCRYHIQKGDEIYWFEDYASAEEKWSSLTGAEPLTLTNLNQI